MESNQEKATLESKIQAQFQEEQWTRISAKDITTSRFTLLDEIIDETKKEKKQADVAVLCKEHLQAYEPSVAARYILGMLASSESFESDARYLNELLTQFEEAGKWSLVEFLANKIPGQDKNRLVLRSKLNALEKLGRTKEVLPVLERLADIDKKNPEVALKFADAVINSDLDKGIAYYKQAAESFARDREFESLKNVWGKLVELIPEDFAFYRKIERVLSGYRQKDLLADLYSQLAFQYIKKEDTDNIIFLCKKVLEYNPAISRFKKEIIDCYRKKYHEHSLLEEFINMSGLHSNKRPVLNAISSFETNIVFDKGNYVAHRSWGVGKIAELNTDEMIIDFKDKEQHKMEIRMALKSLKPLTEDHFWVYQYQQPEKLQEMFENDFTEFFKILVCSFGDKISLSDIKHEIADKYIPLKEWSKWWTKARSRILEDDNIAVSPQRKDILEYHETAISQNEQLMEKFQTTQSDFNDKVSVALDTLKKYREREKGGSKAEDISDVILFMSSTFEDGLKAFEIEVQVLSLILLDMFKKEIPDDAHQYSEKDKKKIVERFASLSPEEVINMAQSLSQTELKKEFAQFVFKNHPDWKKIFLELLFQTPIKIHSFLYSTLHENNAQAELKDFYSRVRRNGKNNAEVFLWSMKNNFIGNDFEGFETETNHQLLAYFRLLKSIPRIETKGTKLKNNARELVLGAGKERMEELIRAYGKNSIRKFAALSREANIFSDLEGEQLVTWMQEINPDAFSQEELEHKSEAGISILDLLKKEGGSVASANAFEDLRQELEHLVNVEMPENSKEIGIAQEKGDLRENAEYKAAMERQVTLQAKVKKLDADLKAIRLLRSNQIPSDRVSLGSKVRLRDNRLNDVFVYSILDQWDADMDRGIIDYKSPLGKALIGHKIGETVVFGSGKDERNLEVTGIDLAVNEEGNLV